MKRPALIATITNLAYVVFAIPLLDTPYQAGFMMLLGLLSGIHHYNYGARRWNIETTRKLDYYGMYVVVLSFSVAMVGLIGEISAVIVALVSLFIVLAAGSSRMILGIAIALLIGLTIKEHGIEPLAIPLGFACVAFVFNFTGDQLHNKYHSLIHGLGWHLPTAIALMLIGLL